MLLNEYLVLLDEVRPLVHGAGGRWIMEVATGHDTWWSAAYLGQAARRVDQVAVMFALYLDYTATPADWAAYRSDWLGRDIEHP